MRVERVAEEVKKAREAEAKARKEAEEAKARVEKAVAAVKKAGEDEARAKKEGEEARVRGKGAAEEAKKAAEDEAKAKKGAEEAAKERAKREAEETKAKVKKEAEETKEKEKRAAEEVEAKTATDKVYSGVVKLMIASPVDYELVRKFEEFLTQVKELRLVLVSGSADEGIKIVVSTEKPVPLLSMLAKMPPVESAVEKESGIEITLKTK